MDHTKEIKEIFTSTNQTRLVDKVNSAIKEIVKNQKTKSINISEIKLYETLKIPTENNNLNFFSNSFKNNKNISLDVNQTNITEQISSGFKPTVSSIFLTFINFVIDNKIKFSITFLILFIFFIGSFNTNFLTIVKRFVSNEDYVTKKAEENTEQNSKIEEISQDLNKPIEGKRKIFSEEPMDQKFLVNNSISPTKQNYLESLYNSLEKLKEKENQLLILREYNRRREVTSDEQKLEIEIHQKRFEEQLKIVKHNRNYYNNQIKLILISDSEKNQK